MSSPYHDKEEKSCSGKRGKARSLTHRGCWFVEAWTFYLLNELRVYFTGSNVFSSELGERAASYLRPFPMHADWILADEPGNYQERLCLYAIDFSACWASSVSFLSKQIKKCQSRREMRNTVTFMHIVELLWCVVLPLLSWWTTVREGPLSDILTLSYSTCLHRVYKEWQPCPWLGLYSLDLPSLGVLFYVGEVL